MDKTPEKAFYGDPARAESNSLVQSLFSPLVPPLSGIIRRKLGERIRRGFVQITSAAAVGET